MEHKKAAEEEAAKAKAAAEKKRKADRLQQAREAQGASVKKASEKFPLQLVRKVRAKQRAVASSVEATSSDTTGQDVVPLANDDPEPDQGHRHRLTQGLRSEERDHTILQHFYQTQSRMLSLDPSQADKGYSFLLSSLRMEFYFYL